jgi:hypothetical protein
VSEGFGECTCLPACVFSCGHVPPANPVILFLSFCCRSNGHKKKKKPQHATVPEGDDEDDDDTDVLSTTASELADDEKYVAKALGKSLGECDDDPDIAEVRKRLLRSSLLSSAGDFGLDHSVDGDIENDSGSQKRNWSGYSIGGSEKGSESDQRNAPTTEATGLLASPDGGSSFLEALLPTIFIAEIEKHVKGKGTSDQARVEKQDDQAESDSRGPPTPEKIRLFAPSDGGSSFAESLRPSIFTTIASMAEDEENKKDEADQAGVASIAEDEENKEDEADQAGVASIAEDEENKEDGGDQAEVEKYDDQDSAKEHKEDECMGGQTGESHADLL